jgi:hypothetical protein
MFSSFAGRAEISGGSGLSAHLNERQGELGAGAQAGDKAAPLELAAARTFYYRSFAFHAML